MSTDDSASWRVFVELFDFRTPLCEPKVSLNDRFKKANAVQTVNLKIATEHRNKLVKLLSLTDKSNLRAPKELIQAVRTYLPYIAGLSLQSPEDLSATHGSIALRWSSCLNNVTVPVRMFEYHTFHEECLHSFFLLGVLHYQLAQQFLAGVYDRNALDTTATHAKESVPSTEEVVTPEVGVASLASLLHGRLSVSAPSSPSPDSKEAKSDAQPSFTGDSGKDAITILKIASGIFAWIETKLLNHLFPKFAAQMRPFELAKGICGALSMLCVANAQELGLLLGMQKQASFNNLARLCIGISHKFSALHKVLLASCGDWSNYFNRALIDYVQIKERLYLALSRKYLARVAETETRYGHAVAFLSNAATIIQSAKPAVMATELQLPCFVSLNSTLAAQTQSIVAAYQSLKKDNESIYFEPVPSDDELHYPEEAFIAAPMPFHPPPASEAALLHEEPLADSAGIFS